MATLAQPIDDVRRPREVQLLIEQLAAAGLELRPLGGPTEQEARGVGRALEFAIDHGCVAADIHAARRWWHGRRRSGATNEQLRQAVDIAAAYKLPEAAVDTVEPWWFTGRGGACHLCREAGRLLSGHDECQDWRPYCADTDEDGLWQEISQASPAYAARNGWSPRAALTASQEAAYVAALPEAP